MARTQVPPGVNFVTWAVPTAGVFPVVRKTIKYGFFAGWSMIGLLWIIRLATMNLSFWKSVNYEFLVATLVGLPMLPTNFLIGMFLHNFLGSVFAFVYAYLFERVFHRVSGKIGIGIGLVHGAITGVLLLALPVLHPSIPGLMEAPGIWYSSLGVGGVVSWFATHLMFGFVMGYQYRRLIMATDDYPAGRYETDKAAE